MQLLREDILFRPLAGENVTEGGLLVPESYQKISNRGVVVAVGSSPKMRYKVGDVVFRVKNWGEEVEIEGVKHYIFHQDTILAIEPN